MKFLYVLPVIAWTGHFHQNFSGEKMLFSKRVKQKSQISKIVLTWNLKLIFQQTNLYLSVYHWLVTPISFINMGCCKLHQQKAVLLRRGYWYCRSVWFACVIFFFFCPLELKDHTSSWSLPRIYLQHSITKLIWRNDVCGYLIWHFRTRYLA